MAEGLEIILVNLESHLRKIIWDWSLNIHLQKIVKTIHWVLKVEK